ncbi:MAG TPA: M48 family metalloprotease [Candidatus Dormibacteraeota bacterium]|nr:M48 family metalloprotease [Candidatus Dormibacteraeota bacterium]
MVKKLRGCKATGLLTLTVLGLCVLVTSARAQLFGSSAQSDIEQGAEVAKLVKQQIGIYSAPATAAYLSEVGQRLATAANDSRWTFRFQIADQQEPNAFAIPGGGIYVSRGLLALVNKEDELAGVLAHEIAHVTERHSARQQRKGFLPGLLTVPGKVVGSVVSDDLGNLINAPIATVGGAWLSTYGRGQETDADRIGIRTMSTAGYNPLSLADILGRLAQDVASQTGQERGFSIFDSHPMTETRLKDIRKRAKDLKPTTKPCVAADSAAVFSKLDGLWWGENPDNGVFQKNQYLHPLLGFTITFPRGWKNKNTPQFVISSEPNKEAALMLGMSPADTEPEAAAKKFIQKMRAKSKAEPMSAQGASIGQFPAYIVTYLDRSGGTATYLHFAWVAMAGKTYELIGLGPERYREVLKEAAVTLRPLTAAEGGSVTGKRLRIVAARKGEKLENLGARSGNAWPPAYAAIVNGLAVDDVLAEGQLIKIARVEPVRP